MKPPTPTPRCPWCGTDPDYVRYHDEEWGVPSHDDRHLFEMLILEGAQAGLSWLTILRKREHYRRVFHNFDAARVARFTEEEISAVLLDPGIVRNRLKVRSTVLNAQGTLAIREEFGSFDAYLWRFVDGKSVENWTVMDELGLMQQLGVLPAGVGNFQVPAESAQEK